MLLTKRILLVMEKNVGLCLYILCRKGHLHRIDIVLIRKSFKGNNQVDNYCIVISHMINLLKFYRYLNGKNISCRPLTSTGLDV